MMNATFPILLHLFRLAGSKVSVERRRATEQLGFLSLTVSVIALENRMA
jgi:hypothetical protein